MWLSNKPFGFKLNLQLRVHFFISYFDCLYQFDLITSALELTFSFFTQIENIKISDFSTKIKSSLKNKIILIMKIRGYFQRGI